MKIQDLETGTIYEGDLIEKLLFRGHYDVIVSLTKANGIEFNKPVKYRFSIDEDKYKVVE